MSSADSQHLRCDLKDVQKKAIIYCHKKSKIYSKNVLPNLHAKLISWGLTKEDMANLFNYFKTAPLIVHFNPERTLHHLLKDGLYKNLFEISAGDSSRAQWENNLFGNIYDKAKSEERVKYGTLNLTNNPKGVQVATGYGHAYLLLKNDVKNRTSFCFDDSSRQDFHISTFKHFFNILYYLKDGLLKELISISKNEKPFSDYPISPYIEAQIHGPLRISEDVECICIPEYYKNNKEMTDLLCKYADMYDVPWDIV